MPRSDPGLTRDWNDHDLANEKYGLEDEIDFVERDRSPDGGGRVKREIDELLPKKPEGDCESTHEPPNDPPVGYAGLSRWARRRRRM